MPDDNATENPTETHEDDGGSLTPLGEVANAVRPDHTLESLQELANNVGIGFGVTLVIQGAVVTGELVSGASFFQDAAASFRPASVTDPRAELVPELIAGMFDDFAGDYPLRNDDAETEAANERPPVYLHLSDAQVLMGGANVVNVGFWRGRLSQVSGWSMGHLTVS